jgi:nucleoside-diphosphate-sugar epimerase
MVLSDYLLSPINNILMTVSILGCGWLGFPLAQYLIKEGFSVKGSTTSPEKVRLLKQAGIESYRIRLPEDIHNSESDGFWKADILFLNIPPSAGESNGASDSFPGLIEKIIARSKESGIEKIIFTSSTSVYSDTGGITTEEDAKPGTAARPSGESILKAEQTILKSGLDYTILRLGGLYGYDRHPVKYLAGKKNLSDPLKPVNLIHLEDCIQVVHKLLRKKTRNQIYNVVSDGHPPRNEFYTSAARHLDLPAPEFEDTPGKDYRIISNAKLKEDLEISFMYPNPMDHTP